MSDIGGSTGVRLIDQQQRVSVVVLAVDDCDHTLVNALPKLVDGSSSMIVVDCVEIDVLQDCDFDAIVDASRALGAHKRRLIVINASPEDCDRLRESVVEVSATSDSAFPDDVDEWLQGFDAAED